MKIIHNTLTCVAASCLQHLQHKNQLITVTTFSLFFKYLKQTEQLKNGQHKGKTRRKNIVDRKVDEINIFYIRFSNENTIICYFNILLTASLTAN